MEALNLDLPVVLVFTVVGVLVSVTLIEFVMTIMTR